MTSEAIICRSNNASKYVPSGSKSGFQTPIAIVLIVCLGFAIPGRLLAQTFTDVSTDYWAYSFIEILFQSGITAGCGGDNYCPESLHVLRNIQRTWSDTGHVLKDCWRRPVRKISK